jgi:hypothetical protein
LRYSSRSAGSSVASGLSPASRAVSTSSLQGGSVEARRLSPSDRRCTTKQTFQLHDPACQQARAQMGLVLSLAPTCSSRGAVRSSERSSETGCTHGRRGQAPRPAGQRQSEMLCVGPGNFPRKAGTSSDAAGLDKLTQAAAGDADSAPLKSLPGLLPARPLPHTHSYHS